MKKELLLLSTLLLSACNTNSIVPSNEPYYCKGIARGWLIAYQTILFKGELVKENKQYYFVNRNITDHGFHGVINEDTKIYTSADTIISVNELKGKQFTNVYALFDPNSYQVTNSEHDVKWISVSSCKMPEIVSKIFIDFDYKTVEDLRNYADLTNE